MNPKNKTKRTAGHKCCQLGAQSFSDPNSTGRDVFNERPTAEDRAHLAKAADAIPTETVLHTTMGDIHIRLFPDE